MGGCASRTKELDGQDGNNLPAEKPTTPEVTADVASTEVKNEVVENQNDKEEPLVDLSSPKPNVPGDVVDAATGIEELKLDAPQNTSTDSADAKENATDQKDSIENHTTEPKEETDDTTDKIEKNAEAATDLAKETAAEAETKKVDLEAEKAD